MQDELKKLIGSEVEIKIVAFLSRNLSPHALAFLSAREVVLTAKMKVTGIRFLLAR